MVWAPVYYQVSLSFLNSDKGHVREEEVVALCGISPIKAHVCNGFVVSYVYALARIEISSNYSATELSLAKIIG